MTLPESQKAIAATGQRTFVLGVDVDNAEEAGSQMKMACSTPLIGKYLIKEKLGQGGMGSIYRVYDPELRRTLALKIIPPSHDILLRHLVSFYRRGSDHSTAFQHSNIIPVLDYGMLPNGQHFTMPEIHGDTLGDEVLRTFQSDSGNWRSNTMFTGF